MKYAKWLVIPSAALCLLGCASTPNTAMLAPIGPAPGGSVLAQKDGVLQVFSARERADVDVNQAEWRMNNDFGKNDFLFSPVHTAYTIYTQDGKVFQHVRNSRDQNDAEPTIVTIPPGTYTVAARAEINGSATQVMLPVRIEPGQSTVAHLQGDWRPKARFENAEVVRLPDGQVVGWRAAAPISLQSGTMGTFAQKPGSADAPAPAPARYHHEVIEEPGTQGTSFLRLVPDTAP